MPRNHRRQPKADIKTYRAKSMQEALQMISREMGPDASVLHSREVRSGLMSWLGGGRQVEVVATNSMDIPSRLSGRKLPIEPDIQDELELDAEEIPPPRSKATKPAFPSPRFPAADEIDFRSEFLRNLKDEDSS